MNETIAVAAITILAVISPGPDFAMVTRNSFVHGASSGVLSALGIGCGVLVHVGYTVFGIAPLILGSPLLFGVMKLLGGGYLMWLGWCSLRNRTPLAMRGEQEDGRLLPWHFFRMGFLTNALNPKTMLFVVATYSQVVAPASPLWLNLSYGAFMSLAHMLWFGVVACFFAAPAIRAQLLARQLLVDRVIGVALLLLALSLLAADGGRLLRG
ncbi:MAG: LysE family transporter [Lautropia sp.]|nr:LysE family transporter [Lautropia sp.]